jgi:hypothetical protein
MKKAICSSETSSVDFQLTTRCYIPGDSTLQYYAYVESDPAPETIPLYFLEGTYSRSVRCPQLFISAIEVTYIGTFCIQATKAPSLCVRLMAGLVRLGVE